MKRLRGQLAAFAVTALAVMSAPAAAQESTPATNTAAEVVGPPQLSNFSLNGTVTRRPTEQPAAPQPAARPATTNPAAPAGQPARAPATQVDRSTAAQPRIEPQSQPSAAPSQTQPNPAGAAAFEVPPPSEAPTASFNAPLSAPVEPVDSESAGLGLPLGSMLPWLLAAILLGAGLWFFVSRQRGGYAVAGAPGLEFAGDPGSDVAARPRPAPTHDPRRPPVRQPIPPAPPRADGGIVSTRLRPWLDVEIAPSRAVINQDGATIELDIMVRNTGAAPARDVYIDAIMLNSGPQQDEELGVFFAHPPVEGERLPEIPPLKDAVLKSAILLPIALMKQFDVGGRKLFVPLIAVNALYRWSAGSGQTSASYLIGRESKSDKMAPFRLDLGARLFRGLGARPHSAKVRK